LFFSGLVEGVVDRFLILIFLRLIFSQKITFLPTFFKKT
jgi:hypothetical protein